MATANRRYPGRRGNGFRILLALLIAVGVLAWFYREPLEGYSTTGAAFAARTACSCRYLAGRDLDDCEKDFEPGMAVVFLSEDEETRSVTASVPLVASETARFRPGYGCVLERWES